MTNEEIIIAIESELKNKTLAVTEQFLEIHTPACKDGKAVIERIDLKNPKTILAYVPVIDEKFYFTFYIDSDTKSVVGFSTEAHIDLYLSGITEKMSKEDLDCLDKPDSFENKIKTMLAILERASEKLEGCIQVTIHAHNANTMFSGVVMLDKEIIKRMNNLNLGIDVDLFTVGNLLK